jgi:hypothetical protein
MKMSTLTIAPIVAPAQEEVPSSSPGIFARLIERSTAAQTARARQIAYRHLAMYSGARLAELGFKPAEIADIRKAGSSAIAYWA